MGYHIQFQDHVTGDETKRAGDDIYGHKGFDRLSYQIFDFIEATDFTITLSEVKEIGAIDLVAAQTNPKIRQTVISNSETIDVALGFYAANQPDLPWATEGFETLSEAREWVET